MIASEVVHFNVNLHSHFNVYSSVQVIMMLCRGPAPVDPGTSKRGRRRMTHPVHLGVSGWQGWGLFASSLSDTVSLFVWHMLHPETRVERVRGFGDWDGAGILQKKDLLKPEQVSLPSCWKPGSRHLYFGKNNHNEKHCWAHFNWQTHSGGQWAAPGVGAKPCDNPSESPELTLVHLSPHKNSCSTILLFR